MSFLQFAALSQMGNSSAQPLAGLPATLLEAFIPGYRTISHLFLETVGFDITLVVSISFLVFALIKSFDVLHSQIVMLVMRFGTCSIEIAADVDTYFWVMGWLADNGIGKQSHSLRALPPSRSTGALMEQTTNDGESVLRIASQIRKSQKAQRYEPSLGLSHWFWHKGHLFYWNRQREYRILTGQSSPMPTNLIEGRLFCLSRSTAPIKSLIDEASALYAAKTSSRTKIRRPASHQQRKNGDHPWAVMAMRPSRPLDTVVLEDKQKNDLIRDIEEYLLPSTRQWYAERGIPYRRGYLLYGPPGTGKTSLSFAIAGVFNLDIYCISVAEPSITEEDLVLLFDALPEQCIVLLEDVDSAGLVVRDSQSSSSSWQMADPDIDGAISRSPAGRISLSGLLNVIDGVASQEGRVLLMTTNNIHNLDSALLRPGRIDLRVHFELATQKQAENLFIQAFSDRSHSAKEKEKGEGDVVTQEENVKQLAQTFAAEIPEKKLSPAEIQGFLMDWKKRPEEAIAKTKEWVKEINARNKKS